MKSSKASASDIKLLQRRLNRLKSQQEEIQQHICNLAYTMSVQLQLLEDLSQSVSELKCEPRSVGKRKENKIIHLKEYLEQIPH